MTASSRIHGVLYITFDNKDVGKMQADAILEGPDGQLRRDQGQQGRRERVDFLPQGWDEAGLKAAVDVGKIKILNGPRHLHRRLEDRDRPDQHGGDPRQGGRRRHQDRCHPRRERRHGARRRRGAHGPGLRQGPRSAARTATPPPSTTWRSATSTSTSGRTPACSARPPARPRSRSAPAGPWRRSKLQIGLRPDGRAGRRPDRPADSRRPGGNTVNSIILTPPPLTADNLTTSSMPAGSPRTRLQGRRPQPRLRACQYPPHR